MTWLETPLSPLALCERGFSLYPDRPAVIDDGLLVTYTQLRERVERLSGGLRELGIRPGDRVALLASNVAPALECFTGVPLSGGILVPLNTRLAPDDLAYVLAHSGSQVILVDPSLAPAVRDLRPDFPHLRVVVMGPSTDDAVGYEDLLKSARPVAFDSGWVDESAVLSINYTSGTTARPKGVMQTHRNTWVNAVNMILAMGTRPGDVHLHVAPMFHANGWGFVWATLAMGAANVMLPRVEPRDVFHRMDRYGVTSLCAAATVLTMLLEGARVKAEGGPDRDGATPQRPRVRVAVAGMAPPAEVIRRVEEELGWDVVHMYGLTETTAFVTYHEESVDQPLLPPAERARLKARQGVPLPLAGSVRVVRPDGSDVARDGTETGEVVARGNVIMRGYYMDDEATVQAMSGGWFHTGDLAVQHPDGQVEIRDRSKDIIISGGENISSLEVEGVLYQHPAVAQAAVVAAPHPLWGETPVAYVVLRQGATADPESIIRHCRDRLAHFKAPTRVMIVQDLPRTASGKIRKHALRAEARASEPIGSHGGSCTGG